MYQDKSLLIMTPTEVYGAYAKDLSKVVVKPQDIRNVCHICAYIFKVYMLQTYRYVCFSFCIIRVIYFTNKYRYN